MLGMGLGFGRGEQSVCVCGGGGGVYSFLQRNNLIISFQEDYILCAFWRWNPNGFNTQPDILGNKKYSELAVSN